MKRFTVLALALVLSFSMLTACSSSEGDTDGDSGVNPETEPSNTYPPTEEEN